MKVCIFSAHDFELAQIKKANAGKHELKFVKTYLTSETAIFAKGCEAVAIFANDDASAPVLKELKKYGVRFVALRSAGYNHIDLGVAKKLELKVAHVPEYSPYSVAEHTIALILALNRKLIKAHNRIHDLNFSLNGLTGFDMNGKIVGIIGLGRIGKVVAKILHGFGCKILAYDLEKDASMARKYAVKYTSLNDLCINSDIITLHIPLNNQTHYLINEPRILEMKKGVMLINTSRGGLVNTKAVINALKKQHIGYLGIDVYEEEKGLFFEDFSDKNVLQDDVIARLMTFKNVLITSHQGFLTETALENIAATTIYNIDCWEREEKSMNELC